VVAPERVRKVRTPQGRAPGNSRASYDDGECHRDQTANAHYEQARVKGWCKRPPEFWATKLAGKPRLEQCQTGRRPLIWRQIAHLVAISHKPG